MNRWKRITSATSWGSKLINHSELATKSWSPGFSCPSRATGLLGEIRLTKMPSFSAFFSESCEVDGSGGDGSVERRLTRLRPSGSSGGQEITNSWKKRLRDVETKRQWRGIQNSIQDLRGDQEAKDHGELRVEETLHWNRKALERRQLRRGSLAANHDRLHSADDPQREDRLLGLHRLLEPKNIKCDRLKSRSWILKMLGQL